MDNSETLNSDLWLRILSFLSVRDAGRAMCSKRFRYLVDCASETRDPELVAFSTRTVAEMATRRTTSSASSATHMQGGGGGGGGGGGAADDGDDAASGGNVSPREVLKCAVANVTSRPKVAFIFYNEAGSKTEWRKDVEELLPPETVVLGARSDCGVQTNGRGLVESDSNFVCMMGSFPQTLFVPFELDKNTERPFEAVEQVLLDARGRAGDVSDAEEDATTFWKVFLLYVVGDGFTVTSNLIDELQVKYSKASIVGGVCDSADIGIPSFSRAATDEELKQKTDGQLKAIISETLGTEALHGLTKREDYLTKAKEIMDRKRQSRIQQNANGVCGIAIGGLAPGHSVVSRGVKSVMSDEKKIEGPWCVHESSAVADGSLRRPVHVVKSVKSESSGAIEDAARFLEGYEKVDYVGIEPRGTHGFELETPVYVDEQGLHIQACGSPNHVQSFDGAKIDLFVLDEQSCIDDLSFALSNLREALKNEKLVGSLMFASSGRGPKSFLLPEDRADANKFAREFPSIPCVGFYAGGEIGPMTLGGTKERGKISFQGFTAMFLVFVVPNRDPKKFCVDDSAENVSKYMQLRMARAAD